MHLSEKWTLWGVMRLGCKIKNAEQACLKVRYDWIGWIEFGLSIAAVYIYIYKLILCVSIYLSPKSADWHVFLSIDGEKLNPPRNRVSRTLSDPIGSTDF